MVGKWVGEELVRRENGQRGVLMGIEWGCGSYCGFPGGWERGPQFPKLSFFFRAWLCNKIGQGWYWGVRSGEIR